MEARVGEDGGMRWIVQGRKEADEGGSGSRRKRIKEGPRGHVEAVGVVEEGRRAGPQRRHVSAAHWMLSPAGMQASKDFGGAW